MKKKIIRTLKDIASKASYESTHSVFLKNAIKVGSTPSGDIMCVYFDRSINTMYGRDDLYLQIIYDFKDCDLYGKDCNFTAVRYLEKDKGKPSFMPVGNIWGEYTTTHNTITMFENALELVLAEVESTGEEWLKHQTHIRIRGRHFSRTAIQNSYKREEKKKITPLTWDEQLEWTKVKAEIEFLMYRRPKNHDYKRYCEMICLGEKEYTKRSNERNKRMMEILKSIK